MPARPGAARSRCTVAADAARCSVPAAAAVRRSPTFPRSCCAAGRTRRRPGAGTASQCARQEAPGVEAPVHPAPHQAQQGAQEDRVSPQVAAVQVCDGLEGVDAAHLQARTPGGEVVLQLSRTEEGRVKQELTTLYFQSTSAAYQPFGLSGKLR